VKDGDEKKYQRRIVTDFEIVYGHFRTSCRDDQGKWFISMDWISFSHIGPQIASICVDQNGIFGIQLFYEFLSELLFFSYWIYKFHAVVHS
jgi:hypothetical protein